MKKQVIFFVVCLLAIGGDLPAQDQLSDSSFYSKSLSSVRSQYMKNIGPNSYLYQGVAYQRYWNGLTGHPFLDMDRFQQGSVYYNGTLYEDVPLMYDIIRDEVISKTFSKEEDLRLLGEKIHSFSIGTRHFIRVEVDSLNASSVAGGFYEKLYEGSISVLAKHQKRIERSLKAEENITRINAYTYFFVLKDGKYHKIETERDLLAVFKEQKAEIRKFLNRRGISFKNEKTKAIVQTAGYYEQLQK
jgi:hypothetical protein